MYRNNKSAAAIQLDPGEGVRWGSRPDRNWMQMLLTKQPLQLLVDFNGSDSSSPSPPSLPPVLDYPSGEEINCWDSITSGEWVGG